MKIKSISIEIFENSGPNSYLILGKMQVLSASTIIAFYNKFYIS